MCKPDVSQVRESFSVLFFSLFEICIQERICFCKIYLIAVLTAKFLQSRKSHVCVALWKNLKIPHTVLITCTKLIHEVFDLHQVKSVFWSYEFYQSANDEWKRNQSFWWDESASYCAKLDLLLQPTELTPVTCLLFTLQRTETQRLVPVNAGFYPSQQFRDEKVVIHLHIFAACCWLVGVCICEPLFQWQ